MQGGWKPTRVQYFTKSTAPTVNDDQNDGYQVSDVWIDETSDKTYRLVDATAGSAVWTQSSGAGQSHDALDDVSTDDHHAESHIHDDRYFTETELGSKTLDYTSGGDLIGYPSLDGATYDTLGKVLDLINSAGRATGGAISDAGSETVNVLFGSGFIKEFDVDTAELISFNWPTSNGISVPTNTTRWIGVEWNSGTPQVTARTSSNWDYDTDFPLGTVVNENGILHIHKNPWWVTDGITNIIQRFEGQGRVVRDDCAGGLMLSVTATRRIVVSGATLWSRLNEFPFTDFTSVADAATFEAHYVDYLGVWRDADLYQYLVTSWNDKSITGTGALAALDNQKYCNLWIYVEVDDEHVCVIYGDTQYLSAATAEAQSPPSNIPEHVLEHGMLIGRIIIKKNVDAPVQVDTVFTTTFTPSQAAVHDNLGGITATNHHDNSDDHASGSDDQDLSDYALISEAITWGAL